MAHSSAQRSMHQRAKAACLQFAALRGIASFVGRARRAVTGLQQVATEPQTARPRQLLIDVSIIAMHDGGTGIQRVVRSLLTELMLAPPAGYEIRPIRATRKTPYRYANAYASLLSGDLRRDSETQVEVRRGDIFLGLDLNSRIAPSRGCEFLDWHVAGVNFVFVVYDLLPALRPEWFTSRARRDFARWFRLVSIHANAILCISQAVERDVRSWMHKHYRLNESGPTTDWFHLAAEAQSQHEIVRPASFTLESNRSALRRCILMVGTVEPRKGHSQALDAFEELWRQGRDVTLVVAGRQGWHTEPLASRLRQHAELGKKLIWLDNLHDGHVTWLYANLGGLLMASEAEGFGLPLLEAATHRMPILARDLPVFREVAGDHAHYFRAQSGFEMAPQLNTWLNLLQTGEAACSSKIQVLDWRACAERIKTLLIPS